MRAAVLARYKEPLAVEEVEVEGPRRGEVRLEVVASGVCHSDLHVIDGATPIPPPLVPGHEAVARVVEVGEGVRGLRPGDYVATSFIWPCGECRYCISGRENLCERFAEARAKGALLDGTTRLRRGGEPLRVFLGGLWAEEAVVPASGVNKIEEARPEYAVLGCAYMTAYGAVVNSAQIAPGSKVAVVGTGGVGLAAVDVAKAVGAEVIAVDKIGEKLELAKRVGARHVVNAGEGDPVKAVRELTDGRGADFVIEAVGADETVEAAVEMAAPGGKVVLVGLAPVGHKTPVHLARVVRGGVTLIGNYGARPRLDFKPLYEMVKRGLINPRNLVTKYYKLDEVNQAVNDLRGGKAIRPILIMK